MEIWNKVNAFVILSIFFCVFYGFFYFWFNPIFGNGDRNASLFVIQNTIYKKMLETIHQLSQTLLPLSSSPFWGFVFFFLISFTVGILAAMFGIGGGFFFTPFFHSVIGLPPVQAVATSMFQIPFMSASGSATYLLQKKVQIKPALWLLAGAIPSSQITAWFFSYYSLKDKTASPQADHLAIDIFLILLYTFVIGGTGFFILLKKSKDDKPLTLPTNNSNQPVYHIPKFSILTTGLLFGFVASALGVGGGFLTVPYFLFFLKMPASQATATSLFTMFFLSIITSTQYLLLGHPVVPLSLLAALGTMSGAQLGSRMAIHLPSHVLKKFFGLIQILVVIVYLLRELPKFFH